MADPHLIHEASRGSREALAEIARRYVPFVYQSALRQVRDPHLADDVTQAVFVILARKIHRLKPSTVLHAWLFTTTRYAACNALKMQTRRIHHERAAAALRTESIEPQAVDSISPLLDEALSELREVDRCAVLLSYFANKSWREVGAAIGVSEDTARKRVGRAIAILRSIFARRGLESTNLGIIAAIRHSAQLDVPANVVQSVISATSAGTVAGSSVSSLIASGVVHSMIIAKLKVAAGVAMVFTALLGGAGAMVFHQPAGAAEPDGTTAGLVGRLDDGVTVEIIALSRREGDNRSWWNPDGSRSSESFADSSSEDNPPHTHQMIVRISGDEGKGVTWRISDAPGWSAQTAQQRGAEIPGARIVTFRAREGAESTDVRFEIADAPYEVLAAKKDMDGILLLSRENNRIAISECLDVGGQTAVTITDSLSNHQRRIVAIDTNGQEHEPVSRLSGRMGNDPPLNLFAVRFDLSIDKVEQIQLQARPYNRFIELRNISLASDHRTQPKVETGELPQDQPGR